MEYQRVGRGGAGNYYSKKDLDEVSKRAAEVSLGTPHVCVRIA